MLKLILLQIVIFFSTLTLAKSYSTVNIKKLIDDPDHVAKSLFESSSLFDEFWSGIDGVDCGEPDVTISKYDYLTKKIHFSISLGGAMVLNAMKGVTVVKLIID